MEKDEVTKPLKLRTVRIHAPKQRQGKRKTRVFGTHQPKGELYL